jgi:hypothetical protein
MIDTARRNRPSRRVAGLLAALALVAVAVVAAPNRPAGAQTDEPTLVVTPSSDLLDGQTVLVEGSGFLPLTGVLLVECPAGATDGFDCDLLDFPPPSVTTDSEGSFATSFEVSRDVIGQVDGQPTALDCAVDDCELGVGDAGQVRTQFAPIDFVDIPRPDAALTITTNSELDLNDSVEVTATGFRPFALASISQCATAPPFCRDPATVATYVHADGSFTVDVPVFRLLPATYFGEPAADCLYQSCILVGKVAGAPIAESVPLDFGAPELTITINPFATLKAGTNDAVASAEIECDRATPVSVHGAVAQPDTDQSHPTTIGTYAFEDQPCTPDAPLLTFIPSRTFVTQDLDFTLAPTTVEVTATPALEIDEGPETTTSDVVPMVDFDQYKAVIDLQLADPANVELRVAVLRAIYARLAQDLVFRLEFIAALFG